MFYKRLAVILICLLGPAMACAQEKPLLCGVAVGFPPYQYQDEHGKAYGLDVDIATEVARRIHREIIFKLAPWDDVVTTLRLERIDFVSGMEINLKRQVMFDFTESYYSRKVGVFALANNRAVNNLYDLRWKVITGDRHSYVEELFDELDLKRQIRIRQTKSKDESMLLLKNREAVAIVAPTEVAFHLAERHGVQLKVLDSSDPGSPVGIAVSKNDQELLRDLTEALKSMRDDGTLEKILKLWRGGLSVQ